MENTNKAMNQASSFLIGALVGSIIGILFAPKKGSDTRKQILSSGENVSDTIKDKYGNLAHLVHQEISDVKSMASEVLDNSIAKVEKVKNNLNA